MSAELAQKLESAGLLGFVVTVFKAYYRVREALAGLWGAFSHAFGRIRAILEPTVRTLMSAYAALASAVFSVVEIFGVAASATDGSSWRTFGTVIGTVAGVLLQGLAFALKIVAWNLSLIVRALAVVVRSVVWVGKIIVGSLIGAAKFIYKFLLPVRMIGEAFVAAGKIVYAVWQVLTGDISLLDGLKAIGGAVYDFVATPFRWARDVVVGVWNFISGIFTSIGRLVADAAGQIGQAILNLPIISTLRDLFATVRSFFAGDTTFFEAGKKLLITLGEGIWSAVTYPFTMLKNALGKLRNLLPFSDAREGPLASLTASGSALLKTLADGMSLTQSLPAKVFGFAARGILSAAVGAWQQIKTAGGNLMDAASAPFRMAGKLWDGLTSGAQTVAAKAGAIFGGLKQSLFGDTPVLALKPPQVNAWDALATGAVNLRDRIVATLSAVPGAVGRIFPTGTPPPPPWQRFPPPPPRAPPPPRNFLGGKLWGSFPWLRGGISGMCGVPGSIVFPLRPAWESNPDSAGGRAETTARSYAARRIDWATHHRKRAESRTASGRAPGAQGPERHADAPAGHGHGRAASATDERHRADRRGGRRAGK
jgi:hypothetical protein